MLQNADIVAAYALDEDTGQTRNDSGPNGLHLTDQNSVTKETGHDGGSAAGFQNSSSQYLVHSGSQAAWDAITTEMSVSLWVRPTTTSARNALSRWNYNNPPELTSWNLWIAGNGNGSNQPVFYVGDGVDFGLNNGAPASNNPCPANTWTHLLWVFNAAGATNADRLKLWINGSAITLSFTGTIRSSALQAGPDFRIGAESTDLGYFDGQIDKVMVAAADWSDSAATLAAGTFYPFAAAGSALLSRSCSLPAAFNAARTCTNCR